ncbi:ABC transporter ATP-binding protein [Pseudomonas sp. TH31]|uniref:ABC transporter ATP-binding protein n=1 Tax=Pseudomonas sp. TH31 TaxID=2796396 RepID=UPI001913DE42|nr:ABC transporter ATP-binding protein [Pseudomonas sp. TH31]MBK5414537.1 ABC transporter ATP-binding protein [Pseudomonas sp. TH31]
MSSEKIAISVRSVSKCYRTYANPRDRLKQVFIPRVQRLVGTPPSQYGQEYWALNDISFDIYKGETVGIVGRNGSGKSTLLQMICGTLTPTLGEIQTNGRVGALLELGSGFNPEFTGRENVYLNGAVLGLTRNEIDARFDSIAAFADIGKFLDQPVKNYSSGMGVRLAFAVQAQIDPDILIVDEALAVGDARFQAKCFERLRQLKENGTSILLVTHSGEQVVTHCSRALLLDASELKMVGEPRKVVNHYMDLLFGREKKATSNNGIDAPVKDAVEDDENTFTSSKDADLYHTRAHYNSNEYRWGDGAATILDFDIRSNGKRFSSASDSSSVITIDLSIKFNKLIISPILGFNIKTKEGVTIFGSNSALLECSNFETKGEAGSVISARLKFDNFLASGDYFISIGVASKNGDEVVPHDRRYDSIHLTVTPTNHLFGLVDLKLSMDIEQVATYVPA